VKRLLLAVLALAAWPAPAADWRETLSAPKPGAFAPLPPLRAQYRLGWGVVPAARAELVFARQGAGEQQLTMTTATTGGVRALWRLDARHEAVCRLATLRPLRLDQTETYRDEIERSRVTFDATGLTRLRESTPLGRPTPARVKPPKPRRLELPNVFDLQTTLLFIRSQRLDPGERYRLVVYPSTSAFLAEIAVVGREKIAVAGQTWPAVKLDIKLQTVNRDLALGPHRKFRKASAWLSDDRERLLLKTTAEVFVGRVWLELERVERALK